jgi:uncharacterized protein YndB with AHSA1/START domain
MTGTVRGPATTPLAVRISRILPAPPPRVFAAWTDPASLARWMSPVGHAEADVEPWVGGRLRVTMVGQGIRIEHTGEYRELVPHRRLVFTWLSPYTGPRPSLVTVELAAVGAGTRLTLIHEHLPADEVARHRGGWTGILDRLAAEVASDAPTGDA